MMIFNCASKSSSNAKKNNILTLEESAELAGITELDRIFTLMNARIIAES
jgi:hypothetical protein